MRLRQEVEGKMSCNAMINRVLWFSGSRCGSFVKYEVEISVEDGGSQQINCY